MSDNTVVFPRKLLKKFIQLYKEQRCLWDQSCTEYKFKAKRHEALTKLTELVQEYDASATRVHVLRKIESLRASVRREFKRVQESRRRATSASEVYVPSLWYYSQFSFVFESQASRDKFPFGKLSPQRQDVSEEEDEPESIEQDEKPDCSSEDNFAEAYSTTSDMPGTSLQNRMMFEEEKSTRHCTEVEDEYDAIGVNVAAKLRNLPANMRILSEKLINDVLFQAQTNSLTPATIVMTPDPFK